LEEGPSEEPVTIEVLDFEDRVVRRLEGTRNPGLIRRAGDLREELPQMLVDTQSAGRGPQPQPLQVIPGLYTVRIIRGASEGQQPLDVLPDPRVELDMTERIAKYQALQRAQELDVRMAVLRAAAAQMREGLERSLQLLASDDRDVATDLVGAAQVLLANLEEVADFTELDQYRSGVSGLSSSYDAPTEGQRIDLIRMEEALRSLTDGLDGIRLLDLPRFRERLEAADVEVFPSLRPIG